MIIHLDKFDHFTLNQNNSKSHVNEQNVLCFLHFNILADVWSEWAGWSSCSVECRGICNRNRNRTCLNETCSGDQAVSMGMLFRINNTEIEEEECNYNNTACKGNFRNKREVPFRLIKIKKALSPFYHKFDLRLFYFDVTTRKRIIINEDYLLQFHFKKEPRWSIQI